MSRTHAEEEAGPRIDDAVKHIQVCYIPFTLHTSDANTQWCYQLHLIPLHDICHCLNTDVTSGNARPLG